jgi:hypothetical protein
MARRIFFVVFSYLGFLPLFHPFRLFGTDWPVGASVFPLCLISFILYGLDHANFERTIPPYLYQGYCSSIPRASSMPPETDFQHAPGQTKCHCWVESIWQRTRTLRCVEQSVQAFVIVIFFGLVVSILFTNVERRDMLCTRLVASLARS